MAESALETARKLDATYKETGVLTGPLHGIPISIKVGIAFQTFLQFMSYILNL